MGLKINNQKPVNEINILLKNSVFSSNSKKKKEEKKQTRNLRFLSIHINCQMLDQRELFLIKSNKKYDHLYLF